MGIFVIVTNFSLAMALCFQCVSQLKHDLVVAGTVPANIPLDSILWHLDKLDVQSSSGEVHRRLLMRLRGSRNEHIPRFVNSDNATVHTVGP